jgi:hypothetical protein
VIESNKPSTPSNGLLTPLLLASVEALNRVGTCRQRHVRGFRRDEEALGVEEEGGVANRGRLVVRLRLCCFRDHDPWHKPDDTGMNKIGFITDADTVIF